VSKENKIKKRLEKNTEKAQNTGPVSKRDLSPEERAQIIRDRLANRPVIMFRYPNGKLNLKLILTLAVFVVALIAALYIITR
jgi:hypothetical protein